MNTFCADEGSPSKTYKIKLFEKEIKVQLTYSSPPKLNKENRNINGSMYINSNKQKKSSNMASATKLTTGKQKKKQLALTTRQKQFYANRFQQSKNILEKYEQFHNHMAQGKIKARLKVYSNSKGQIFGEEKGQSRLVPIRTVNITNTKREASPKPIMKIKLYSNQKSKGQLEKSLQKPDTSKLTDVKEKQQQVKKEGQKSLLTPSRSRKYKLQVTTSKSRGKNDSIISNREQLSKEIRQIQLKNYNQSMADLSHGNVLKSINMG